MKKQKRSQIKRRKKQRRPSQWGGVKKKKKKDFDIDSKDARSASTSRLQSTH